MKVVSLAVTVVAMLLVACGVARAPNVPPLAAVAQAHEAGARTAPQADRPDCVDAEADVRAVWKAECERPLASCLSPELDAPRALVGDLDGDGVDEIAWGFGATSANEWHLYRGGPDCAQPLGVVMGDAVMADAGRHGGWRDLRLEDHSACEGAPCGCTTGRRVYQFANGAYHEEASASTPSSERPCNERKRK